MTVSRPHYRPARRKLCSATLAAAVLTGALSFGASPVLAQAAGAEPKVLNVYNWSDYIAGHDCELREGNRHQGALRATTTTTRSCMPS